MVHSHPIKVIHLPHVTVNYYFVQPFHIYNLTLTKHDIWKVEQTKPVHLNETVSSPVKEVTNLGMAEQREPRLYDLRG